ncbi:N-formylglutamate amidohydrolase [Pandoraea terrae]|uniref:N-formylglutamate amidohydrolase n=1 Tax=Pandoraea terrae TaxID=1537710 RepID=A0A5E4YDX0_9BURK|nr:N-formylglutamate amidohydrolase [Pandoraea terrae]VVE46627.1 N-formylglutamate amidohydrolase [Pandoraea terrae]
MSRHVIDGRYFVEVPKGGRLPLVLDSPHSGIVFPADFDPVAPTSAIYASWDAHVDELWSAASQHGATLIGALFPRAYIDPNRAPHDIDPDLLDQMWPHDARPSDYSARGMGLIRRLALPGVPLYDRPLSVAEVERRVHDYYTPYRHAVRDEIDAAWHRAGIVWHINCHSMKSRGNAMNLDPGELRPDIVVSDREGTSADPSFSRWVVQHFNQFGYKATYNTPYRGGDLVRLFGHPEHRRHSIQIEINRALYMNEESCEKHEGFAQLQANLTRFLAALAAYAERHSEEV